MSTVRSPALVGNGVDLQKRVWLSAFPVARAVVPWTPSSSGANDGAMPNPARAAATRATAWLPCVPVAAFGVIAIAYATLAHENVAASVAFAVGNLAIVSVGLMIATGSSSRFVGWLLVGIGVPASVAVAANGAGIHLLERDGTTLAVRLLVSTTAVMFAPIVVCTVMIGLTFPDGRLLSPRWRPLAWLTAVVGIASFCIGLFEGWLYDDLSAWLHRDTWGGTVGDLPTVLLVAGAVWDVGLVVACIGAASCLLIRLHRSGSAERGQIRWVVFAGVVLVVSFAAQGAPIPSAVAETLPGLTAVVVAAAFAIAVLRHGMWDVEIILRRSMVYGVLWAAIAGIYVFVGTGLGVAATSRLPISIAITLTVATTVVFEPARRRLEALADRVVFGPRPNPLEVIAELSERLANADQVGDTARHLADAAGIACDLAWAEVTVSDNTPVTWGTTNNEPVVEVPIGDRTRPVGLLRCQPRAGFELDVDTHAVLCVLAAQTALGIAQARLTARLAHASAEERRRLERDLHDGAQQELVALIARLGLARATANGDSALFDELQHDVQRILADLRALAQGIHPSVLTVGGLGEAVRECADRLPLPIGVDIDPDLDASRPDPDIESAAYFLVAEALTNTVKHAHAHRAAVSLSRLDGRLRIEIADDGDGFDPAAVERRGLAGIEDRIVAHGGTLQMRSDQSTGTTVIATIPSPTKS